MYTVLFICTANICRTPMANSILMHFVMKEGLEEEIQVESAGTWAVHDAPASPLSVEVCREHGLDASGHRSRPVDLPSMNNADLVLCMTTEHRNDLQQIFPHLKDRIFTLKEYGVEEPRAERSIMDPYGRNISEYRKTFQEIYREIERFWPLIKKNCLTRSA